jgi:hypothetical protein
MEAPIINETPVIMLISTALLLDSNSRNRIENSKHFVITVSRFFFIMGYCIILRNHFSC